VIIYIVRDDDPDGGYFSFGPEKPTLHHYPASVMEVRAVEDNSDLWGRWSVGKLPTGLDGTFDYILAPLWVKGETVWKRDAV
jgi:hypothetical protein